MTLSIRGAAPTSKARGAVITARITGVDTGVGTLFVGIGVTTSGATPANISELDDVYYQKAINMTSGSYSNLADATANVQVSATVTPEQLSSSDSVGNHVWLFASQSSGDSLDAGMAFGALRAAGLLRR